MLTGIILFVDSIIMKCSLHCAYVIFLHKCGIKMWASSQLRIRFAKNGLTSVSRPVVSCVEHDLIMEYRKQCPSGRDGDICRHLLIWLNMSWLPSISKALVLKKSISTFPWWDTWNVTTELSDVDVSTVCLSGFMLGGLHNWFDTWHKLPSGRSSHSENTYEFRTGDPSLPCPYSL